MRWPFSPPPGGFAPGDRFGPRESPGGIGSTYHRGVDSGARYGAFGGASIPASGDGRVIFAGYNGGLGNWVEIDHGITPDGNRLVTGYAHQQAIEQRVNWERKAGDRVGPVGTTGASTGNHLHFETRVNGVQMDPEIIIPRYADFAEESTETAADVVVEVRKELVNMAGVGIVKRHQAGDQSGWYLDTGLNLVWIKNPSEIPVLALQQTPPDLAPGKWFDYCPVIDGDAAMEVLIREINRNRDLFGLPNLTRANLPVV